MLSFHFKNIFSRVIQPSILAFIISFVLPFTVYFYNKNEFIFNTHSFFVEPSFNFLLILAIFTPALFLKNGPRQFTLGVFSVLSAYLLIVNFIIPVQVGFLDGIRDTEVFNLSSTSYLEMAKYFSLLLVLIVVCRIRKNIIRDFVVFGGALSFIWVGYVTWGGFVSHADMEKRAGLLENPASQNIILSKKKNIFVISFDALQGDIVEEVIVSTPALKARFDGFTFFSNTSSAAANTARSLISMMFGKIPDYLLNKKLKNEKDIIDGIFPTLLSKKDYQVILYGYELGLCDYVKGVKCFKRGGFFNLDQATDIQINSHLLRYAFMRVLPTYLFSVLDRWIVYIQSSIYGSKVLIKDNYDNHLGNDKQDHQFGYDYYDFEAFKEKIKPGTNQSVVHVHHYLFTHLPLNFDEFCNYHSSSDIPQNAHSAKKETRCALKSFAGLMEQLKKYGIYDNSLIILMSDHGYGSGIKHKLSLVNGLPFFGHSITNPKGAGWASRYHPALMFKDFNSKGEMLVSNYPASLLDIAPTICRRVYDNDFCAKKNYQGEDLATLNDMDRERSFLMYIGGKEKMSEYISNHSLFKEVYFKGDVRRAIPYAMRPLSKISCGDTIDFTKIKDREGIWAYGLSGVSPSGSWTDGNTSMIQFLYDPKGCKEVSFNLEAHAFINAKNKKIEWSVFLNGNFIGELIFEYKKQNTENKFFSFNVPKGAIESDNLNLVEFKIKGAKSPSSLGLSKDKRVLGLGLISLSLNKLEKKE